VNLRVTCVMLIPLQADESSIPDERLPIVTGNVTAQCRGEDFDLSARSFVLVVTSRAGYCGRIEFSL
jgi:hypothetical protein